MKIKYKMIFIAIIRFMLLLGTACDTGSNIEVDLSTGDPTVPIKFTNGGATINFGTIMELSN